MTYCKKFSISFEGPWFIADVLEGEVGVLFVWGLYVKGTLLPGCLAYLYGTFHVSKVIILKQHENSIAKTNLQVVIF